MKTYRITVTGKTPLLMHHDNIDWSDRMEAWRKVPANKANSKAGDDRTPPFMWLGSLYHDAGCVVMPADNVMACLMGGAALVPTGKGKGTYKSRSQSGIMPGEMFWPLVVKGQQIPTPPFFDGMESRSFDEFQALAAEHGFMLFLKRARIGQSKHVRVRPRFDAWSASGSLTVSDDGIDGSTLRLILDQAGRFKGLGDWRPGSKTPGPWGMFEASIEG